MTDEQSLDELLRQALDDIDEVGGRERHLLRETIGAPTYDKLISKPRTADLVDRWLSASAKAKGAATKTLAVQIARVADKPELLSRIEREINDNFSEPNERSPTPTEARKHAAAVNQKRNGQRSGHQAPKGVNLSLLAKGNDLSKYIKARLAKEQKNEIE